MPLCENKDGFVSDKIIQLFTRGPGTVDKDVLNYRSYHRVSALVAVLVVVVVVRVMMAKSGCR